MLDALQRVTDAALAHCRRRTCWRSCCGASPRSSTPTRPRSSCSSPTATMLRARAAKGIEEEVERGVRIPVGTGFAGRDRGRARGDHDRRRRPRRHPQPDPAREGHPLAARRPAVGRGPRHRRAARRQPHPAHFTAEDARPAPARRRPRRARDRARAAVRGASARARVAAEAARARLEALQRITDAALAYLPEDELLHELLTAITRDPRRRHRRDPAARRGPADAPRARRQGHRGGGRARRQIPVGQGFAGRIAAERRAIAIEDVDHADILNPILREKGIRSLLGVPLLVEGRVLGVLHVGSLTPAQVHRRRARPAAARRRPRRARDRARAAVRAAPARRGAAAAAAARSDLAGIAGLELASRYLPASGESLGGDWYDAFALGGGRIVRGGRRRRRPRPRPRRR